MKIMVPVDITPQRLADLMITAVECNDMTAAWCAGVRLRHPGRDTLGKGPWYADPTLYAKPFLIEVREVIDEAGDWKDPANIRVHRINADDMAAGLNLMAREYPQHFGDFIGENEDAVTADVFLQCVALKDVVYG